MKLHESVLVFSGLSGKTRYFPIMKKGKPYRTKPEKFKHSNYGVQERPEVINLGTRYPTSVVEISNPRIKGAHPTQKPVSLMSYFIQTYSLENETVLDNCMGSGSTGVSAIECNRNFIGIELNKDYFEAATKRIQDDHTRNDNQPIR